MRGGQSGYVDSNPDGDDGGPLTDYDVIGSAVDGTGLFALRAIDNLSFLCVPPPARDTDAGPGLLLVANRYCRERRAILVVDPPRGWDTPEAALAGIRDWPFASDNAVMYFPRIAAHDRLRGIEAAFAPCGAVAGMLSRAGPGAPAWTAFACEDQILRPGLRPATPVSEHQRQRLAAAGINTLQSVRLPGGTALPARTLAGRGSAATDWRLLQQRRLAQFVIASIERGTRWLLFVPNEAAAWRRAEAQVQGLFGSLEDQGAFAGRPAGERWFVVCDERLNRDAERGLGVVNLVFGFAAARPGDYHAFLLSHRPGGSRVHPVTMRRLLASGYCPELLVDASVPPVP
jgi:phage tail sheath protein FI